MFFLYLIILSSFSDADFGSQPDIFGEQQPWRAGSQCSGATAREPRVLSLLLQVLCEQQDPGQVGVAFPLKSLPCALRQAVNAVVQWLQSVLRV